MNEDKINKYIQNSKFRKKGEVEGWINDVIQDVIDSNNEVYIYCDITLRNNYWGFIGNKEFNTEKLEVLDDSNKTFFIRINSTDKVPDYNIGTEVTMSKGLFSNDNIEFYMVIQKSDISHRKGCTKFESPDTLLLKQRLS